MHLDSFYDLVNLEYTFSTFYDNVDIDQVYHED